MSVTKIKLGDEQRCSGLWRLTSKLVRFPEGKRELDSFPALVCFEDDPGPFDIKHFVETEQAQERDNIDKKKHYPDRASTPILRPFCLTLPRIGALVLLESKVEVMKML
jgi:hypothetical protein